MSEAAEQPRDTDLRKILWWTVLTQ